MPVKNVESTPLKRALRLIHLLLNSRTNLPLTTFRDSREWGDERTFRRLRQEVNDIWKGLTGGDNLFEIVNESGLPTTRGTRFLKVNDTSLPSSRIDRMAVMPAYLQLLSILKGTFISEEYQDIFKDWTNNLTKKQQKKFDRTKRKFFYFGKGVKNYSDKADLIEEIYNGLLLEKYLEVTKLNKHGEIETRLIRPLTLVLFNNGLYLNGQYEEENDDDKIRSFKIETFLSVKWLKKPFVYPKGYDPSMSFDGSFGMIRGDKEYKTVLEFDTDSLIHTYLKERTWTGEDTFTNHKGDKSRLTMKVSDLREVESWALSFGSGIKVLQPKKLQDSVKAAVKKMNRMYR